MSDPLKGRSVRVELDGDDGASTPVATEIPRDSSGRRAGVLVILGVAIVVMLLLAARPDRTADADAEVANSTSSTSSTTVVDPPSSTTTINLVRTGGLLVPTTGLTDVQSIVRAPVGFLALGWNQADNEAPPLFRSLDGVTWTAVDVNLSEAVSALDPQGRIRSFQGLTRLDEGYTLAMATIDEVDTSQPGAAGLVTMLDRLISSDGETWELDPSFERLLVREAFPQVIVNDQDAMVLSAHPYWNSNEPLQKLLAEHVIDGGRFAESCWAEPTRDEGLTVPSCRTGAAETLEAADLVEPSLFDSLSGCVSYLSGAGGGIDATVLLVERDAGPVVLGRSNVFAASMGIDGVLAAIELGPAPWLDADLCVDFATSIEPTSPAIIRYDPSRDDEPRSVTLADDVDITVLVDMRAKPALAGRELRFVAQDGVQPIDIDTGEWGAPLPLAYRMNDETSAWLTNDGMTVVQLSSTQVIVTDLRTGAQQVIEDTSGGNRPGFPSIVYADDGVAFARGGESLFKVDLDTAPTAR